MKTEKMLGFTTAIVYVCLMAFIFSQCVSCSTMPQQQKEAVVAITQAAVGMAVDVFLQTYGFPASTTTTRDKKVDIVYHYPAQGVTVTIADGIVTKVSNNVSD